MEFAIGYKFVCATPGKYAANLRLLSTLKKVSIESVIPYKPKEALNKWIPFMVRRTLHERNQYLAVRPKPVEGLNQSFPKLSLAYSYRSSHSSLASRNSVVPPR
jgi:hypothetical protein